MRSRLLVLASLSISLHAHAANEPAPAAAPIRVSKIILVGDSTVAVQGGWGSSFCSEHVTQFVACVNLARQGRSSGSYIAEGSWQLALNEARAKGYESTWMLIQFGHNDQPGKPGRSTDLATEFPANLRRYVSESRAAGARPILITPLTRRIFKNGALDNTLVPWATAIIRVANEMKVPVIDLNARSSAAVQAMGPTAANAFAALPPSAEVAAASATGTTPPLALKTYEPAPSPPDAQSAQLLEEPKLTFDYTHLGRIGADYFAKMVTEELAKQIPETRPLLFP